jgi:hypothetical protein
MLLDALDAIRQLARTFPALAAAPWFAGGLAAIKAAEPVTTNVREAWTAGQYQTLANSIQRLHELLPELRSMLAPIAKSMASLEDHGQALDAALDQIASTGVDAQAQSFDAQVASLKRAVDELIGRDSRSPKAFPIAAALAELAPGLGPRPRTDERYFSLWVLKDLAFVARNSPMSIDSFADTSTLQWYHRLLVESWDPLAQLRGSSGIRPVGSLAELFELDTLRQRARLAAVQADLEPETWAATGLALMRLQTGLDAAAAKVTRGHPLSAEFGAVGNQLSHSGAATMKVRAIVSASGDPLTPAIARQLQEIARSEYLLPELTLSIERLARASGPRQDPRPVEPRAASPRNRRDTFEFVQRLPRWDTATVLLVVLFVAVGALAVLVIGWLVPQLGDAWVKPGFVPGDALAPAKGAFNWVADRFPGR